MEVVLHGQVRTMLDVNVLAHPPQERVAEVLEGAGYEFDPVTKEF